MFHVTPDQVAAARFRDLIAGAKLAARRSAQLRITDELDIHCSPSKWTNANRDEVARIEGEEFELRAGQIATWRRKLERLDERMATRRRSALDTARRFG